MAHILLADDDPAMLSFISTALERAEHTCETFDNGLDALIALKSGTAFDLVLTDVVMPGMDGIELSQEARILNPDQKVMFISGFSASALPTKSGVSIKGNMMANMMAKPFHLNDLVARVNGILTE